MALGATVQAFVQGCTSYLVIGADLAITARSHLSGNRSTGRLVMQAFPATLTNLSSSERQAVVRMHSGELRVVSMTSLAEQVELMHSFVDGLSICPSEQVIFVSQASLFSGLISPAPQLRTQASRAEFRNPPPGHSQRLVPAL